MRFKIFSRYIIFWTPRGHTSFQHFHCIFFTLRHRYVSCFDIHVTLDGQSKIKYLKLHDSYFRSMTIKHAIPKTAEVTYSDGQLWEEIEWTLNYYITQCTGNSKSLGIRRVGDKCGRENQHPERLGLRPPV